MSLTTVFDSLLFQAAGGPNVFTYFGQSNFAGKIVVMVLIVCSVLAWSVLFGKYMDLSRLRSQNKRYERLLGKKSICWICRLSGQGRAVGRIIILLVMRSLHFFAMGGIR